VNEGDIDFKHGSTVIGRVCIDRGLSQHGIFTVPAGKIWLIDTFSLSVSKKQSAATVVEVQVKSFITKTWQTITIIGVNTQGNSAPDLSPPAGRFFIAAERSDIRVRMTFTDSNDIQIAVTASGFLAGEAEPITAKDVTNTLIRVVPAGI